MFHGRMAMSHMMSDRAASGGPEDGMMMGQVSCKAAHGSAAQATLRICGTRAGDETRRNSGDDELLQMHVGLLRDRANTMAETSFTAGRTN